MFNLDNLPQRGLPQKNSREDEFTGWGVRIDDGVATPRNPEFSKSWKFDQPSSRLPGGDKFIKFMNSDVESYKKGGKIKRRKSKYTQKQKQKQNTNIRINIGDKGSSKAPQFIPQYIGGGANPTSQVITIPTPYNANVRDAGGSHIRDGNGPNIRDGNGPNIRDGSGPNIHPPIGGGGGDINVSNLLDRFARLESRIGQPVSLDMASQLQLHNLGNLINQGIASISRPRPPPPPPMQDDTHSESSFGSDYPHFVSPVNLDFSEFGDLVLEPDSQQFQPRGLESYEPLQIGMRPEPEIMSSSLPTDPIHDLQQQLPVSLPADDEKQPEPEINHPMVPSYVDTSGRTLRQIPEQFQTARGIVYDIFLNPSNVLYAKLHGSNDRPVVLTTKIRGISEAMAKSLKDRYKYSQI